jgi:hypothetical protein
MDLQNTNKIEAILDRMQSISLDEILNIRLMDRVDSKFIAPLCVLPQVLEEMVSHFKVQINNGKCIAPYETQYLDTSDLHMFLMHQNGKLIRQKIRIRSYVDSHDSFLEVKNKNEQGRTIKIRVPVDRSHIQSVEELIDNKDFLEKNAMIDTQKLQPVLANEFKRITLVNNRVNERVTLDFDLSFVNYQTNKRETMPDLLVLELKQDSWQLSDFRNIMNRLHIIPSSFSKYCMGMILTHPRIQYNRFKRKWIIV